MYLQICGSFKFAKNKVRKTQISICGRTSYLRNLLKVPKHEKFVTELFTLSDPIWIGDMRTEPKKPFV